MSLKKNKKFGFFQVEPTPSQEEITQFYKQEFYSGEYKKFNDSSLEVQEADMEFYRGGWGDIVDNIQAITNKSLKGVDVLDIGCGWSQALIYFSQVGANCYGFDPAPEAVKYAANKGLNVIHAGMERMNVFEDKKFDIVLLKNVLEHLSDPEKVLSEIHRDVLKPGGLLIIDVPNEFNDFQLAGRDLHGLSDWWVSPPGHLNYFDSDSLGSLLAGTGFKVKLKEASFPLELFLLFGENYVKNQDLGTICHRKRVAFEVNMRKLGYGVALHRFYQALAEVNLGRQVTIYAVSE